LHRRRFVQDGDVPVTVLRRDQAHDQTAHRAAPSGTAPTTNRLQRAEAALAAEPAMRERAERALSESQNAIRDLQTKIGHAELAKTEAVETLQRERDSLTQLRSEAEARDLQLQEALEQARAAERNAVVFQEQLNEERQARKTAEKALRSAEAARESAEQLVRALSEEVPAPRPAPQPAPRPVAEIVPTTRRTAAETAPAARRSVEEAPARRVADTPSRRVAEEVSPPRRATKDTAPRRPAEPARRASRVVEPEVVAAPAKRSSRVRVAPVVEPEPVKWWLNTKPAGKRR
jgi:hypothetical protein